MGEPFGRKNTLIFAHFRKKSVVVGRKKIYREICKRYYCVPVGTVQK